MSIIAMIENQLGKKANIDFQPMQLGDVKESFAYIEYSKEKLGFSPKTSIDEGIPNFINWYNNYFA